MSTLATFSLHITYGHFAVAEAACDPPLNDWQDRHVAQGFAWRPGCVAFGTLKASGPMRIEVARADSLDVDPSARRAIVVPFEVGPSGVVLVLDAFSYGPAIPRIEVGAGRYALLFETASDRSSPDPDAMRTRLTFIPDPQPAARILRADDQLSPGPALFLDARPI